jgi:hypothetical protein
MANQTQRYYQQQQQQYYRMRSEQEVDENLRAGGRGGRKDVPIFSPRAKVTDSKGNVKQRTTGWTQNDPNDPDYDPKQPYSPVREDVTEVRYRPARGYAVPGFWESRSDDWTGPSHSVGEGMADWTGVDHAQVARRPNSGLPTGLTRRMKTFADRFAPGDAEEPPHPWAGQLGGPKWGAPATPGVGLPQRLRTPPSGFAAPGGNRRVPGARALGAGPQTSGAVGAGPQPAGALGPGRRFAHGPRGPHEYAGAPGGDVETKTFATQYPNAIDTTEGSAPSAPSALKSKSAATRARRKTRGMADPRTKMTRQAIGDYGRSRLDEMKTGNGTQEPPSILFGGEVPEGSEEGAARPLLGTQKRPRKGLGRGPGH